MASFDESCDLHPTVVNIELRLAWDGAWYPFDARGDEKSFTGYYGESAEHFWELAKQRTRRAVISSISCGASEAAIELFHSSLELSQTRNALDFDIARSLPLPCGILPPVVASGPANGCEYVSCSTQTPWDGLWHALIDMEDERSFAGYYIDSVEKLLELAADVSVLLDSSTSPSRTHLRSFFEYCSGLAPSSSTVPLPIDLYSDVLKDAGDGTMKDGTERDYAPVVESDTDCSSIAVDLFRELSSGKDKGKAPCLVFDV